ncbi:sugar ABC transporter ATP-binding protein [Subtercola sp. YIM 133946]|uniref:sugar ABC transporter ATP-binding protein n=1 Tax=Subtercola sp. YIM 133946 TaxID=3118909 RepID=UPI002F93EF37
MAGSDTPRLSVRNATKTFGAATVLDRVSIDVQPGEIHGLIGQNGSGKSTLIKLLSGFHSSDAGTEFAVDGRVLALPIRPHHLQELGVSFVHQDLGLDERATVLENVRVGRYRPSPLTRNIDFRAEAARVSDTLARLGSSITPGRLVGGLSMTDRTIVAIARALQDRVAGTGCIVFDEATQSLPRNALSEVYSIIRRLAEEGTAIVIVSHRLDEVLALTDRVSVLRDGRLIATVDTAASSELELTGLLLDREQASTSLHEELPAVLGETRFEVRGLATASTTGIRFSARRGETIGIIGGPESGYSEILPALAGVTRASAGTFVLDGTEKSLSNFTIGRALAAGIAYVPEDRAHEGLALPLTQLENLTLPRLRARSSAWRVTTKWQRAEFDRMSAALGIRPYAPIAPASTLSGGNQQKLLLAKWLGGEPSVLLAHEPTQAVDVGARRDILRSLRQAARTGAVVVIASVEADDLATVCDTILVVTDGVVSQTLTAPFTAHSILASVYAPVPA